MVVLSLRRCFAYPRGIGRGFKHLLKVLRAHGAPVGLRPSDVVSHGHHLLPMALPILVPLDVKTLG
jgi:hypothetical protein